MASVLNQSKIYFWFVQQPEIQDGRLGVAVDKPLQVRAQRRHQDKDTPRVNYPSCDVISDRI